jgi:negative regulator of sigma E activity
VSRLRLLLLVTGLGALISGVPAFAGVGPDSGGIAVAQRSAQAVRLLESAAQTARTASWSGTQHVVSTRAGEPRFTVLQIHHIPGTGSAVRVLSSQDQAVAADSLDEHLLLLLARHYDLRVIADTLCSGRPAHVVEALRPGISGAAALAGRFWIDEATGLLLRRDVLDEDGDIMRTSEFVSLSMAPKASALVPAAYTSGGLLRPTGRRLDDSQLQVLEAQGWPVASALPAGLELFEARLHDGDSGDVLQLSYSDGLSALSLFVQNGELPRGARDVPGSARPMAGNTVWVLPGAAEQVVWAGGGHTWTLVSDAPQSTIVQAVGALPHTPRLAVHDGLARRTWRGMSRVGAWLNPFD